MHTHTWYSNQQKQTRRIYDKICINVPFTLRLAGADWVAGWLCSPTLLHTIMTYAHKTTRYDQLIFMVRFYWMISLGAHKYAFHLPLPYTKKWKYTISFVCHLNTFNDSLFSSPNQQFPRLQFRFPYKLAKMCNRGTFWCNGLFSIIKAKAKVTATRT